MALRAGKAGDRRAARPAPERSGTAVARSWCIAPGDRKRGRRRVDRHSPWALAVAACCAAVLAGLAAISAHAAPPPAPAASAPPPAAATAPGSAPAAAAASAAPAAAISGDWPFVGHDPQGTRFSPLDQIRRRQRRVAAARIHLPDRRRARPRGGAAGRRRHDVRRHALPELRLRARPAPSPARRVKWKFDPKPRPGAQGRRLLRRRQPGRRLRRRAHLLQHPRRADDRRSTRRPARELWRTKLGDIQRGETMTMAPLVVKGKVLVGNSGGELGVRGWLTALDAATGTIAWRACSTGPDSDVLIGPALQAVLRAGPRQGPRRQQLAGRRLEDRRRHRLGLRLLRPEHDLVFYGTGNPGPWNPEQRPGDNKWSSGIFARRPDDRARRSGTTSGARTTCTTTTASTRTSSSTCPSAAAIARCCCTPIATATSTSSTARRGQVLSADPFVPITTSTRRRPADRRAQVQPAEGAAQPARSCATSARRRRAARTGSPRRGRRARACSTSRTRTSARTPRPYEASYIAGTPYVGVDTEDVRRARAATAASSPPGIRSRARRSGAIKENFPVWSGALATAGDVVFYGTMDGWFKAVDAKTGALLWKFKTGSGNHRPADQLPRARRQAVHRRSRRRRRLGRRVVVGGPRPARQHRRRSASSTR